LKRLYFQVFGLQPLILVFCLTSILAHPSSARADYERSQRQGDIEAKLVLETAPSSPNPGDQTAVRLSGEFLKLEITGPPSLEVTAPEPFLQTKNWQGTKTKPDEIAQLPGGRRRWRGYYRLDPDRPGPTTLQFAGLTVRTANGTRVVEWPPIPVTVVTSIQHASPDELFEDLPLEPFEELDVGNIYVPVWVGVLALALGFVTTGFLRYRQACRLREEVPAVWVRRHINELRTRNQGTPEQIAHFYSELADLLRLFIERRFAVPAPTRTTREFLGDLQKSAALEPNQRELLERFLVRCELVKFARESPSLADCDAAVELVLRFVDESAVANALKGPKRD
jgi:hypothetical protein